jgi:hypothetical protein
MALALTPEELQLEEGLIFKVDWTDPENIGTVGGADPASHYANKEVLGYMEAGSMVISQNRSYTEAKAGTPRIMIRKDLVEKLYRITANTLQINNPDLWEIRDGLLVQKNYIDTGFTGDLGHLGPREPTQQGYGFLIEALTVDGIPILYTLYNAFAQAEDISETRSGDAYVTIPLDVVAFPHANFDLTDREQQKICYGLKWLDRS